MRSPIEMAKRIFSPPDPVVVNFDSRAEAAEKLKEETEKLRVNDPAQYKRTRQNARVLLDAQDGCVFVLSDQHYYKGITTRSHQISVKLAQRLKPWALICNGDAIDAASVSRWPVGSFTELAERPLLKDEIDETVDRLREYEELPNVRFRVWNLGNHDARFETRLAERAEEYVGIEGTTLKDHFPGWLPAWRVDITGPTGDTEIVIQHRFKGGMHAGQNNALWAGTSIVTGHDHMLKAYPITQVNQRTIWGIHSGMMAQYDSPNFKHYTEDRIVNWQEGFVILHFKGHRFIGPELVYVQRNGEVLFRGEIL